VAEAISPPVTASAGAAAGGGGDVLKTTSGPVEGQPSAGPGTPPETKAAKPEAAKKEPTAKEPAKKSAGKVRLSVHARVHRRFRAGLEFTPKPQEVEVTAAVAKVLRGDRLLKCKDLGDS